MSPPHILVVPFPAQGHVIPLLELSLCLVKHGFRVTFVNTDYNHKRVINTVQENNSIGDGIHLVSIPDGMEPGEDRNVIVRLIEAMHKVMPGKLEELIEEINRVEEDKLVCVIADGNIGFALAVAEKMKVKKVAFWPAAAATLALFYNIPKMIDDGIIDTDGTPIKKQIIQVAHNMPEIDGTNFIWYNIGGGFAQKKLFDYICNNTETVKVADSLICNSTYDFEPGAFNLVPNMLPVGPLLASNRQGNSTGYFWQEDSACLEWLDQQEPNSVIYVAFGSFTVINKIQFRELALGLELTNKPFLWVVRPDITDNAIEAFPEGFQDRVVNRGKMVGWAPQQKVLSHPSIACFFSHCGWNSTIEGLSSGLPFLCWPYFADQFIDESYICDIWKVGLKFNKDENGIVTREEIKTRIGQVLGDEKFKVRALELKKTAIETVKEGGESNKSFNNFIEWIKA